VFIERIKAAEPELVQISTAWRSKEERRDDELLPYEYTIVKATEIPASVEDEQEPDDEDEAEAATAVCNSTKAALITYGNNVGKRVNVCTDPDCAVHHPRRAIAVSADFEERQKKVQQEREARKKAQAKREKRFTAIMQRFPSTLTDPQTRFLLGVLVLGDLDSSLEHMAMRLDNDESMAQSSEDVCAKALTELPIASLPLFFAEIALGSYVDIPRTEETDLLEAAEAMFPAPKSVKPAKKASTKAKKTASTKAKHTNR